MSDYLNGLIVAFEEPLHEHDAQLIMRAIKLLRNVADVKPLPIDIGGDKVVRMQVNAEWRKKLHRVTWGEDDD